MLCRGWGENNIGIFYTIAIELNLTANVFTFILRKSLGQKINLCVWPNLDQIS